MSTAPVPVAALPAMPDSSLPEATFDATYEAFNLAMSTAFRPQVNAIAGNVYANAQAAETAVGAASGFADAANDSATEAFGSETRAATSVIAAASAANAPLWTAKNYAQGERSSSTINGRIYRRTTPGVSASATDPSLDPGGWIVISNSLLFMPPVSTATVTAQAGCFYAVTGAACTVTAPAAPAAGDTFQVAICNALTTNIVNWAGLKQENLTDATTTLDVVRVWTFTYINAAYGWRIY